MAQNGRRDDHDGMSFKTTTERRKAMTPNYDVTSTFVNTIDVDPDEAHEVLASIDPMRTLADRLSALGLDDRAIWSRAGALEHRLIWRFGPGRGHVRIDWQIVAERNSRGGTVLTTKVRGHGSDAEARKRVLGGWLLVEEMARAHARRLAGMLEDYAEEDASAVPRPLRLVVG
jgi:hypothetical protein